MSLLDQLDSLETQQQADAAAAAAAAADTIAAAKAEYLTILRRRNNERPGDARQLLAMAAAAGITAEHRAALLAAIVEADRLRGKIASDEQIAALMDSDEKDVVEARRILTDGFAMQIRGMSGGGLKEFCSAFVALMSDDLREVKHAAGRWQHIGQGFAPAIREMNSALASYSRTGRASESNQSFKYQINQISYGLNGAVSQDFEAVIERERY
ncbi:MAG TPA: hypothetical protein VFE47_17480 [Tepidisphaeraceae bacterium]|jgi:hypothetical protein|nr:hypothetical protein [Tepidisphaeraceae bacterium]